MYNKTIGKKFKSSLITFGTIGALAAINYSIIHSPLVFVFTFVLFVHELGHYLIAKLKKADVSYPIFIPFPFIGIGLTRIRNLSDLHKSTVAIAGLLFSSLFLLNLIFHNIIYNFYSFSSLFFIFITEILFNYFGSDGHKYRQSKI